MYSSVSFNTCIDLCNYHHNQLQNSSITLNNPLMDPTLFYDQTFPLFLNPYNRWLAICPYSFVFSRLLYRWNHTVCNHWSLASFTQHLKFFHVVAFVSSFFLLIACVVFHYIAVPSFVYPFSYWRAFEFFLGNCK